MKISQTQNKLKDGEAERFLRISEATLNKEEATSDPQPLK